MEDQKTRLAFSSGEGIASDTIPSFLLKTYEILENDKFSDIICWTKNGEGFIVKKVKEFSESILPIYFRHSNYTSFVRQLNMYDFHKTRQQNHQNAFKNLMFKRGFKNLLKDIQRKDYKKNKDNPKQTTGVEKSLERSSSFIRNQKQYEAGKDTDRLNFKKMNQVSFALERKALCLAQLREIPEKQSELLRLLDVLFEAKKLQKELINRMEKLCISFTENQRPINSFALSASEKSAEKIECALEFPSTEAKESRLQLGKEEHQIGTNVSLFSSFNQI